MPVPAVNTADRRPVLIEALGVQRTRMKPRGEGGHPPRVRVIPVLGGHLSLRVWGIYQRVVLARPLPCFDLGDLCADADHGVAEAVDLFQSFRLGRLD